MLRGPSYSATNRAEVLAALSRPTHDWALYREDGAADHRCRAPRGRPGTAAVHQTVQRRRSSLAGRAARRAAAGAGIAARGIAGAAWRSPRRTSRGFMQTVPVCPQSIETRPGVSCRREVRPIPSAGLYVPGGTAPLVSTVLMLGIPAKLAGVGRIVLCTPREGMGRSPVRSWPPVRCWASRRFLRSAGREAIAALAYGTESVPKAAKIAGPGNVYVSAAKAEVSVDPEARPSTCSPGRRN